MDTDVAEKPVIQEIIVLEVIKAWMKRPKEKSTIRKIFK